VVDTNEGVHYYPADMFSRKEVIEFEGGPDSINEYERIQGYGARLSAPGYLDCTEWVVFDYRAEAVEYLQDTYEVEVD
jgi:hypothetical protein